MGKEAPDFISNRPNGTQCLRPIARLQGAQGADHKAESHVLDKAKPHSLHMTIPLSRNSSWLLLGLGGDTEDGWLGCQRNAVPELSA